MTVFSDNSIIYESPLYCNEEAWQPEIEMADETGTETGDNNTLSKVTHTYLMSKVIPVFLSKTNPIV